MKVRVYLVAMAAGIFIPIAIFLAVALDTLFNAQRQAAFLALEETARLTTLGLDREFAVSTAVLRTLSNSNNLADANWKDFYEQARLAIQDNHSWILLLDEDGQQLLNTIVPFGNKLPPPVAKERVRNVLATGKPTVSNLVSGPITKLLLLVLDYPVTLPNGKRYILSYAFRPEYFARSIPQLQPSWLVGIFDRDGRTVMRSRPPYDLVGQYPRPILLEAMRSGRQDVFRNESRDAAELYSITRKSDLSGWSVVVGVPVEQIESAVKKAVMTSALGLLVALALSALFAALFARKLVRSISSAARAALMLGRDEVPAPLSSGIRELDALHAAQAQAGKLLIEERTSREQVEAERARLLLSEETSRKLIEQERAKALANERDARKRAEMENQAKDQFLAMLGHEIRNPLAAIDGAISLMDLPDIGEERQSRAREILKRQSSSLTRIVDDLLDLARVSSGKLTLSMQPQDVAQSVATCIDTLHATGRIANHLITLQTEPAWVNADKIRLEQIINNLLGNAIKYTPDGGKIEVSVGSDVTHALITVRDYGVGILPDLLPRLFEVFVQGDASLDRSQGGLGIGLALVSKLTHMHGGTVSAHSDGAGYGSTFVVRIPLIRTPFEHVAQDAVPDPSVDASRRVLLIEDNADARRMLADLLFNKGFEILEAADGDAGIRVALTELPDVAVIDIGLPGKTGFEVARALRSNPATSGMRLLALSGYGQESDRRRTKEAGFDAHFAKPVNIDILTQAIRRPQSASEYGV